MIVLFLFTLILIFVTKINLVASVKFGFAIHDELNIFAEKFVAFGILTHDISEEEALKITDNLNRFYRYQRKERQRNSGFEGMKFSVNIADQIKLTNGNHQVALKGELSIFLAAFRSTMVNAVDSLEIWTRVKFYSDPIASISESTLKKKSLNDVKVFLLQAAFDNPEIVPNADLEEIEHSRSLEQSFDDMRLSDFNDDDSRYTIFEFPSPTDSLMNPLLNGPRKTGPESKSIDKENKSRCYCCNPCIIV